MRIVTVQPGQTINLGYQYDNESTQVVFPNSIISQFTDAFGTEGSFAIWYRRSGDTLGYPIGSPLVVYAGGKVTWTITEADVANPGSAQVQLRYVVDEVQVMSQVFSAIVSDSVDIGSDIPEPMEAWADAITKEVEGLAVTGLSSDIKDALLDCFAHVAWIDDQGQEYYDALEEALYPHYTVTNTLTGATSNNDATSVNGGESYTATITAASGYTLTGATVSITMDGTDITSTAYNNGTISIESVTGNLVITVTAVAVTLSSISAVYTQSGTVYTTDSLDSLKTDLVVTATWSDTSTSTVAAADYTLSGTLTAGTSTITVTYGGKIDTFTVTVTANPQYVTSGLIHRWDGIDNTENGHSSSTELWEDLVGTVDLTKTIGTWSENALSLSASIQDKVYANTLDDPTDCTVEVCFSTSNIVTTSIVTLNPASGAGARSARRILIYNDNTVSGKGDNGNTYENPEASITDIHTITVDYTGFNINHLYVNGVEASLSNKTHSFRYDGANQICIGGITSTYPFTGNVHCVRIYNRALTSSEVAQNYALDVSRFNLGA